MVLRIDEAELKALLKGHATQIGYRSLPQCLADIIAGLGWPMAAFSASWAPWIQWPIALLGCIYAVYAAVGVWRSRHRYTDDDLLEDIVAKDRTERRSTLIAVRDASEEFANRYLLYWDAGWQCWFLPNRATNASVDVETGELSRWLSDNYEIPASDVRLQFVVEHESAKYSTEHQETRYYEYRLYKADALRLPDAWQKRSEVVGHAAGVADAEFTVAGRECRWMTVAQMQKDPRIMQVNADVVGFLANDL